MFITKEVIRTILRSFIIEIVKTVLIEIAEYNSKNSLK